VLEHQPEGRTELVGAMRGHDTRDAATCMVLMAKHGKTLTRFVLAVIAVSFS
jgi:Ala-tRNA(Pro) deacylase